MNPQEILDIINAFFQAILDVFRALGIIKPEEGAENATTEA